MNFGQSGKKSPLGRAAINRMTQNLVSNNKTYVNRMSTFIDQPKTPRGVREMWKPPKEDKDEKEKKEAKKAEKRVKTVIKQVKDMEVFETEFLDSDEADD